MVAARARGREGLGPETTPRTGTSDRRSSDPSATAVAVLQATTTSLAPCSPSQSAIASARAVTSEGDLSPYGNHAVSPK